MDLIVCLRRHEGEHDHAWAACIMDAAANEIELLRGLVCEVWDSGSGDIRYDPGPSEILAETGWYQRAAPTVMATRMFRRG